MHGSSGYPGDSSGLNPNCLRRRPHGREHHKSVRYSPIALVPTSHSSRMGKPGGCPEAWGAGTRAAGTRLPSRGCNGLVSRGLGRRAPWSTPQRWAGGCGHLCCRPVAVPVVGGGWLAVRKCRSCGVMLRELRRAGRSRHERMVSPSHMLSIHIMY